VYRTENVIVLLLTDILNYCCTLLMHTDLCEQFGTCQARCLSVNIETERQDRLQYTAPQLV